MNKISELSLDNVDYKKQILLLKNMPKNVKLLALEKINEMALNNNDFPKQSLFVKELIRFPWDINEKVFDVELVSVNNEPVSKKLQKNYTINTLTNSIYKFFSKKDIIMSNTSRFRIVRKLVKKWIEVFNVRLNIEDKKGEAVIVILKKK